MSVSNEIESVYDDVNQRNKYYVSCSVGNNLTFSSEDYIRTIIQSLYTLGYRSFPFSLSHSI